MLPQRSEKLPLSPIPSKKTLHPHFPKPSILPLAKHFPSCPSTFWISISCGNTSTHWCLHHSKETKVFWNTPPVHKAEHEAKNTEKTLSNFLPERHLPKGFPKEDYTNLRAYVVSVVPEETEALRLLFKEAGTYITELTSADFYPEISKTYDTLGVDRASALAGAQGRYSSSKVVNVVSTSDDKSITIVSTVQNRLSLPTTLQLSDKKFANPCLVIDGGTMMTTTASGPFHEFLGGTITPGISTLFGSMSKHGRLLPNFDLQKDVIPDVLYPLESAVDGAGELDGFGLNTKDAMVQGVILMVAGFLRERIATWVAACEENRGEKNSLSSSLEAPYSYSVVFCGGDGNLLSKLLAFNPAVPAPPPAQVANGGSSSKVKESEPFKNKTPIAVPHLFTNDLNTKRKDGKRSSALTPIPTLLSTPSKASNSIPNPLTNVKFVYNKSLAHYGIGNYLSSPQRYVGVNVAREFDQYGPYLGVVKSWEAANLSTDPTCSEVTHILYTVDYEDGDSEDCSEAQVIVMRGTYEWLAENDGKRGGGALDHKAAEDRCGKWREKFAKWWEQGAPSAKEGGKVKAVKKEAGSKKEKTPSKKSQTGSSSSSSSSSSSTQQEPPASTLEEYQALGLVTGTRSAGPNYIGLNVAKKFESYGTFFGEVKQFNYPWFKVLYEDGDGEDMDAAQLQDAVGLFNKESGSGGEKRRKSEGGGSKVSKKKRKKST